MRIAKFEDGSYYYSGGLSEESFKRLVGATLPVPGWYVRGTDDSGKTVFLKTGSVKDKATKATKTEKTEVKAAEVKATVPPVIAPVAPATDLAATLQAIQNALVAQAQAINDLQSKGRRVKV